LEAKVNTFFRFSFTEQQLFQANGWFLNYTFMQGYAAKRDPVIGYS
jgi:hypothetical protein